MQPNIIIFNPDQMRADALAHLGNPASSTPFLDQLAQEEAVSFRNAFCQNPVCVPSRCSFFTGRYPHTQGHRTMQYLLHDGDANLLGELKAAGYHVWVNDRNDLFAGQILGLMEANVDEIFYPAGDREQPGPVQPNIRGEYGGKNYYSHYEGCLGTGADGIRYSNDDQAVDAAIQRILNPVNEKPLCIFLGLMYPHPPYGVEEPYFSMIDREKLPQRAGMGSNKPYIQQRLREEMRMEAYTEADWDEMRGCYLGMCRKVDDQFRRLCNALKEAGIYDNTAIFFFSDHGDYTGDYGIPEKAENTFEDCLTNVPLLIKPPKGLDLDPGITDSLVELVDFYATAMDFAGVCPSQDHFGMSLRPILADRKQRLRDYVFCEGGRMPWEVQCDGFHTAAGAMGTVPKGSMYYPRQMAQTDHRAHAKGTMIRSERYKYVHRITGEHEFYDLAADPLEEKNRYGEPAVMQEVMQMRMAMLDWYQRTCDVVPREYDSRMSPEAMWHKVKHQCPPEAEAYIRSVIASGAGPAVVFAALEKWKSQREGTL